MKKEKLEEIIRALEGITYEEWKNLKWAVNRHYKYNRNNMKIEDTKDFREFLESELLEQLPFPD